MTKSDNVYFSEEDTANLVAAVELHHEKESLESQLAMLQQQIKLKTNEIERILGWLPWLEKVGSFLVQIDNVFYVVEMKGSVFSVERKELVITHKTNPDETK